MSDIFPKFKAAVAQISPSFLNRDETVEKACTTIEEAGGNGAKLIAFPESFIPGYPYWLWMETPFDAAKYFKDFFKNSVEVPSPATKKLCRSAKKADCNVVMGMSSREGGTLYNAMLFIDSTGEIIGYRRKLIPTVAERTVWGRGDGSDLRVYNTDVGNIGGLICGENNMFLVKYALLAKGEQIHISNYPGTPLKTMRGFNEAIELIMRSFAILGQVFVLNAINVVNDETKQKIFDTDAKMQHYFDTNNGGASIISPRGVYLAAPELHTEKILYADIDMEMIIDSKWATDCVGHYARPDVTRLVINEERYTICETAPPHIDSSRVKQSGEFSKDLTLLNDEIQRTGNATLQKIFSGFLQKYISHQQEGIS